jgi:hypothetical protein
MLLFKQGAEAEKAGVQQGFTTSHYDLFCSQPFQGTQQAFDIFFIQLLRMLVARPDITHHAAAITGTVGHKDHNGQGRNAVRPQCPVALKRMI